MGDIIHELLLRTLSQCILYNRMVALAKDLGTSEAELRTISFLGTRKPGE